MLIIARLTLKLKTYAFLMITPLAVYFVVLSGAHRGPDVRLIVYGALLAVPVVVLFGLPMRVMRGSAFILNTGPSASLCAASDSFNASAFGTIDRNLMHLNLRPFRPTRSCRKLSLIHI